MKQQILFLLIGLFWINLAFTQPIVIVNGSENSQAVKKQILQYLDYLDVRGNVRLSVSFTRDVPKDVEGMTFCQNLPEPDTYQIIWVRIDARLNKMQQRLVLAHEMIHVKQFAKGELIVVNNQRVMWKGKYYHQRVYSRQRPWELEAYQTDHLLVKQSYKEVAVTLTALDSNP